MKLVRITNYKLEVEDELLLLKPFKEVYKADKSKDKIKFFDFMTIVYYTYDPIASEAAIKVSRKILLKYINEGKVKLLSYNELLEKQLLVGLTEEEKAEMEEEIRKASSSKKNN